MIGKNSRIYGKAGQENGIRPKKTGRRGEKKKVIYSLTVIYAKTLLCKMLRKKKKFPAEFARRPRI